MIFLLVLFAAFGLWRVTVVLRKGEADRSTGLILVAIGPLMAAPVVLLAWLGEERDIHVPMEQAVIAGGLGVVCVVLGVFLLVAGKKRV
jgi:hypothetical protein